MPEQTYEIKTVGVDYLCDKCSVGIMLPTGIMLTVDPPLWQHQCSHCNSAINLGAKYPTVRWERLEKIDPVALDKLKDEK